MNRKKFEKVFKETFPSLGDYFSNEDLAFFFRAGGQEKTYTLILGRCLEKRFIGMENPHNQYRILVEDNRVDMVIRDETHKPVIIFEFKNFHTGDFLENNGRIKESGSGVITDLVKMLTFQPSIKRYFVLWYPVLVMDSGKKSKDNLNRHYWGKYGARVNNYFKNFNYFQNNSQAALEQQNQDALNFVAKCFRRVFGEKFNQENDLWSVEALPVNNTEVGLMALVGRLPDNNDHQYIKNIINYFLVIDQPNKTTLELAKSLIEGYLKALDDDEELNVFPKQGREEIRKWLLKARTKCEAKKRER